MTTTRSNLPDACLPTVLLQRERLKLIGSDKSKEVTMAQCYRIAKTIQDNSITPAVADASNVKQRAMHLRRVAGAQRASQTRQRNAMTRANGVVVDGQVELFVQWVLSKRWNNEDGRYEYETRWKDHGADENTWSPPLGVVIVIALVLIDDSILIVSRCKL